MLTFQIIKVSYKMLKTHLRGASLFGRCDAGYCEKLTTCEPARHIFVLHHNIAG